LVSLVSFHPVQNARECQGLGLIDIIGKVLKETKKLTLGLDGLLPLGWSPSTLGLVWVPSLAARQSNHSRRGCGRFGPIVENILPGEQIGVGGLLGPRSDGTEGDCCQTKFLSKIKWVGGGIKFGMGTNPRAQVRLDMSSRAKFLTLLDFRRKFP